MCFVFSVLFNDALNCQDYIVSVVDKWIGMEHWWNNTDRGKTEVIWHAWTTKNPTQTAMESNQGFHGGSSQLPAWTKYRHVAYFPAFLYSLQCRVLWTAHLSSCLPHVMGSSAVRDWHNHFCKRWISSLKHVHNSLMNFILDKNVHFYTLWSSCFSMTECKVCKTNKTVEVNKNISLFFSEILMC